MAHDDNQLQPQSGRLELVVVNRTGLDENAGDPGQERPEQGAFMSARRADSPRGDTVATASSQRPGAAFFRSSVVRVQRRVDAEGDLQPEPDVGVVEVETGNLADPVEAVEDGVAVDGQDGGRLLR